MNKRKTHPMLDVTATLDEVKDKMEMAVMYLEDALAHIRAGKASTRLLDGIRVDSYGSMVPLNNVAAVNTPDARTIAIKPWDKNMFRIIEKAILDSDLGITPRHPAPYGRTPQNPRQTVQQGRRDSQNQHPQRPPRHARQTEKGHERRTSRRRRERRGSQIAETP